MDRSFSARLQSISQSPAAIRYTAGFLIVTHVAGIIGLAWPLTRPYFQFATPANLLVSAGLLVLFQPQRNKAFYFFLATSFIVGFGIEVIGVQTEVIFGSYEYGNTLGYKFFGVPLVIGLNWFMLSYSFGILCYRLPLHSIAKSVIAALLMVFLDFFIEPVAIFFNFWRWENNMIPVRNFVGWFTISLLLQLLFTYLPFIKKNPLASVLIIVQYIFFLILSSIV